MAHLTDSQWRAIAAVLADGQPHSDQQLARAATAPIADVRSWLLDQEQQLWRQADGPVLQVTHQIIEFGQPAALRVQYLTRAEYNAYCARMREARAQRQRDLERDPECQRFKRECEARAAARNRR
jgi:hypothetical protein